MTGARDVAPIQEHEVVDGCLGCPHADYCAGMGKCDRPALDKERIKKGVLRARGWFSSAENRNVGMTVEMVDALALDVVEFAGEIVHLQKQAELEEFADYVMARLDP